MRVRGQFGNPFIVDVHPGGHAVVGGGVALFELNGFAVHTDFIDLDIGTGIGLFAADDAHRGEGQAFRRFREFQADRVVAEAVDHRVGRGDAFSVFAPVLLRPGGIRVHQVRFVHAELVQHKVRFHRLHGSEGFLVHDHGRRVVCLSVEGTGVGGQLGNPFVVNVHPGGDAVVGRGVALFELNRFTVHTDRLQFDRVVREGDLAAVNADGGEGQPLGFLREFQAHRIFAVAGHRHVLRGYGRVFVAVQPVLLAPVGIGIHQVGGHTVFRRFFRRGKADAAEDQAQRRHKRQDG